MTIGNKLALWVRRSLQPFANECLLAEVGENAVNKLCQLERLYYETMKALTTERETNRELIKECNDHRETIRILTEELTLSRNKYDALKAEVNLTES
jgi:septal ring factor EnvC (AmiA/AmiB activator)